MVHVIGTSNGCSITLCLMWFVERKSILWFLKF
jgi:hypothetical protein